MKLLHSLYVYLYRCFKCGFECEVQFANSHIKCPLCGHGMVFNGTRNKKE